MSPPRALTDLSPGESATVLSVSGEPELAQRLAEFGLFEGESFQFLGVAPLGDPIEILVGQTRLSLRKSEAVLVLVSPLSD